MPFFRHYSFDLWLTLIKSNLEFKKKRAEYLFKNYNSKDKSLEEVQLIIRKVDLNCNAINERTGRNLEAEEMYLFVLAEMNELHELQKIDLVKFYDEVEHLFFTYPPVFYSDETKNVLFDLKQKSGATFSILSNTAFIKGETLNQLLENLEILSLFSFNLYSDQHDLSKPNPLFFNLMFRNIKSVKGNEEIEKNEILHVGDNPIADIFGAESTGFKAQLINSNECTIAQLLT